MNEKVYAGLDEDLKQGVGPTAKIVLDARLFGLIGEEETCKGWNIQGLQSLMERVDKAWMPFGLLPSRLPPELRSKHASMYEAAVKTARANGWDPDSELEE